METTSLLIIVNNGPEIVLTNYWDYDLRNQKFAFNLNAGCLRLLVPNSHRSAIKDMVACEYVIASRLKTIRPKEFAIEFLFEDHSWTPFCIHLSPEACLGLFPVADNGTVMRGITIWTDGVQKVAELPLYIRYAPRLPWMKPLSR